MTKKDANKQLKNIALPNEPFVIVDKIIKPYTNYRATEYNGKHYIPVANYDENNTRDHYTTIEEMEQWVDIYGLDKLHFGIFAENFKEEE